MAENSQCRQPGMKRLSTATFEDDSGHAGMEWIGSADLRPPTRLLQFTQNAIVQTAMDVGGLGVPPAEPSPQQIGIQWQVGERKFQWLGAGDSVSIGTAVLSIGSTPASHLLRGR